MRHLWQRAQGFVAEAGAVCLITILSVKGSSPREAGTRMLVRSDGRFTGTIGGGALEWLALAEAQRLMQRHPGGGSREIRQALGPDLGQCCGGHVTLLLEAFSPEDDRWIAPLVTAEAAGPIQTEAARDSRGVFRRHLVQPVEAGAPAVAMRDTGLFETFGEGATPLMLFGAGHVGRALVLALAPLPFAIRWIDSRPDAFPAAFPANALPVLASDGAAEIASAKAGTILLAMTHSHGLDLAIASAALQNPAIGIVGVIGSATKAARFRSQLAAAGLSDGMIARLTCPIGLTTLRSKDPAVIAAGLVVQLLTLRETALEGKRCAPLAIVEAGMPHHDRA